MQTNAWKVRRSSIRRQTKALRVSVRACARAGVCVCVCVCVGSVLFSILFRAALVKSGISACVQFRGWLFFLQATSTPKNGGGGTAA